jgi:phosphate transport system substrate-binding protein
MRAAVLAGVLASLPWPAAAQDATLTARDGGLSLSGDLLGFDGEFYRLRTGYGDLTVDAAAVICDGPACPDLAAPRADIRITGAEDAARRLLPPLLSAFARARGLAWAIQQTDQGFTAQIDEPRSGQRLGDITFTPAPPAEARRLLDTGAADLSVAALAAPELTARVLALEALVPLVARDNPVQKVRTADLARALTGEITNWRDLGGPDMPVVLHGLRPGAALQIAAEARLGQPVEAAVIHDSPSDLAEAVARDPWALALSGVSVAGEARVLPITDSCDFPLPATALGVKSEDYPLSAHLYLLAPKRRLPLLAREFLEFLATDAAQAAVAAADYIDRRPTRLPLTGEGQRLLNAIRNAGPEVSLDELQRLAAAMTGAERLSLTFRFEDGASALDAASKDALAQLARLIAARTFDGYALTFAGFSDGSGEAAVNLDLSRDRAQAVRAALARDAPDLAEADLPAVDAFGEALPIACDTTFAGRKANRRVELWLHPLSTWDGPPPDDPALAAQPGEQVP